MDEGLSKAVAQGVRRRSTRQGLIYKDKRLVNWDPKFQTAISDLEVEQVEARGIVRRGPRGDPGEAVRRRRRSARCSTRDPSGHMYHFRYPLAAKVPGYDKDYIVVATTRPETMLGDTGVAVHPEDERYAALIGGRKVMLPLVGREIPIVADEYSDPEKGTGAVKITPAHDFNDFEVGKRHDLEQINMLDDHGAASTTSVARAYRGLDRFEARKRVVADLEALGLLEKIEPTTHAVPHGDRSGVVIEPWLTDQWYVNAAELAKPAIAAVESGKTAVRAGELGEDLLRVDAQHPAVVHLAPALVGASDPGVVWAGRQCVRRRDGGRARRRRPTRTTARTTALKRDEDVLDTWFSSALWPFSTLGWPDKTPELDALLSDQRARHRLRHHLLLGRPHDDDGPALHEGGAVPRRLHPRPRARREGAEDVEDARATSSTRSALIDEYGADALRFTLAAMAAQGRDVKLVDAARRGLSQLRDQAVERGALRRDERVRAPAGLRSGDGQGDRSTAGSPARPSARRAPSPPRIEAYKFNEAASAVYEFVWGTFCDWYLELIKPILSGRRRGREGRDARHGRLGARPDPEAAAPVHAVHHRGAVGARWSSTASSARTCCALQPVAGARGPRRCRGRRGDRLGGAARLARSARCARR